MTYTKVTDKQYRMDQYLVENLNFCHKRMKANWDNVIIIDGKEGTGKSTMGRQVGYYFSYITKKSFGTENIFFDPAKLLKFASVTTNQVIIFDEAAIAAMANNFQSQVYKTLMLSLIMSRKKGHLWIFILPRIYWLSFYLAIERSIALIHTYSRDNINRGDFTFYNEDQKENIYMTYKNNKRKDYSNYSFAGNFVDERNDGVDLIDYDLYEKNKDQAILEVVNLLEVKKGTNELFKEKYDKVLAKLEGFCRLHQIKLTQLADYINITTQTIRTARKSLENKQSETQEYNISLEKSTETEAEDI